MGSTAGTKKKAKVKKDFVSWFEIPSLNFQQSVSFYNFIFDIEMEQNVTDSNSMAFFPVKNGIGGAVISGVGSVPSDSGPLIYLNAGNDLNDVLNKIEPAGGRVIMKKTLISESDGFFAIFIDCQGNKLALHSKK
ncbi:MAG: VOC family protein [Crocinitomicaceae bacterium]